ncbi:thiamine pyrophosphate-dependent enzyme [Nocardia cyriacigeorgica]|uniref:thiamine pyrophosphate-dependent enzyme n=1 Tax=Nocardia cyriacigeorgica TaxID=135487 RepID=UPI0002EC7847|nr:thiamine pyrophosphate-dependent enzyme [Nocardia cyriacigeorgica]AVH23232.1 MFS transporter [Nocardia cyriacigeorgica]MBF6322767.1 MFS transporter [Nocardia cyriacigeorgica]PPJ10338.1 MFS transporter [Nocardia cyriacigeorgica]TLF55909.1 MFS transporter [Nocardia cyriacigeorgica]
MSAQELEQRFRAAVRAAVPGVKRAPEEIVAPGISAGLCVELFDSQVTSRQLDLAARQLGRAGRGYYSIGSSGHEGNAALAIATRVDDPALLHYRSGAFFVQRARQVPGLDPVRDVLLGVVAAATDPIAGGRHKVFGSKAAAVIPQTSTIASHLPRAVGLAFALERGVRLGVAREWPQDAVVLCTFGDASANHSTATGAINAAVHTAHLGVGLPILFVCEDNGIGISVPTPPDWIATAYGQRRGLRYFDADGCDLLDALTTATDAVHWVRTHRAPAFLRLRTVRLLGHAGSDVETAYRAQAAIAADAECDPVAATARMLITVGISTPEEVAARYDAIAERVAEVAEELGGASKLASAAQVMAPLAPAHPGLVRADVERGTASPAGAPAPTPAGDDPASSQTSSSLSASTEPDTAEHLPLTLAQGINHTLRALLARDDDLLVFGEDVARKGGVYGVTKGLRKEFGARRVFDTLLDEQSVLGTALGAGLAGFVPIPEIQYLAYVHNALDQLRGEAATLQFFSEGRYRNPMVVRVAGLAYQRGFGGHFHNDNSVAALRDIPGLVVAVPARADDAAALLRTCVSAARVDGRVCVIVEPIALYHHRDLYESGDDGWLAPATAPWHVPIGRARTYGDGTDLTIVTFGNGVPMSLRVARRLAARGVDARVLDLRWLAPLPHDDLLHHAEITGRVLVADETRRSGGVAESVFAALLDAGFAGRMSRVTSADSFVPLGPAASTVLLDETAIEAAAVDLVSR